MSEELKLLPCPRCGSRKRLAAEQITKAEWRQKCNSCQFSIGVCASKEEALAVWNSLPRKLRFSREKPTQDGWYWYRDKDMEPTIGFLLGRCLSLRGGDYVYIENAPGEFAGPIQEPEEE